MEKLDEAIRKIDNLWNSIDNDSVIDDILRSIEKSVMSIDESISFIPKGFGLYIFYIESNEKYTTIHKLEKDWIDSEFSNYPKVIKKRFKANTEINGLIPFYLGKSEKVGSRIWEHINHHKKHPTYGLKLKERIDFKSKNKIKVGYWIYSPNEEISKQIKQLIITHFEEKIREKINPLIGKQ